MQPAHKHPLPNGWSAVEVVEDMIVADGLELRRAGVASLSPTGEQVTACAVERATAPLARGYFELLERVSTLEAIHSTAATFTLRTADGSARGQRDRAETFLDSAEPLTWRYARSNGVAIHDSWPEACRRARLELVERDRVLRAWYGETQPEPLAWPTASALDETQSYRFRACRFPAARQGGWSVGVEVVGVFGFPTRPEAPFIIGYGARESTSEAFDAATREASQALGFLWGEPLPETPPAIGPSPAAHLESLLFRDRHTIVDDWLDRGHRRFAGETLPAADDDELVFADLTPSWLEGLHVAKAMNQAAAPLAFGDSPYVRHLPPDLRAHPIP